MMIKIIKKKAPERSGIFRFATAENGNLSTCGLMISDTYMRVEESHLLRQC